MTIAELVIDIGVRLTGLQAGFQAAGQSLDSFVKQVSTSEARLAKLGAGVEAFGLSVIGFLALATHEATKAADALVKLGAAADASTQKIDIQRLRDQAAALQRVTVFSDEAVLSAQRFLVQVGLTQAQIEALTPRILNLATSYGIDLDTAARAVARSMTFGTTAIRRMGVAIEEGIDPAREFSRFLGALDKATGDSATRVGATLPGAIARLRNAFSDLLETIGGPVLAPLTRVLETIQGFVEHLTDLAQRFPGITAGLVGFTAAIGVLAVALGGLLLTLAAVAFAINQLSTPAVVASLGAISGAIAPVIAGFLSVVSVVGAVVGALLLIRAAGGGVFDDLVSGAQQVLAAIGSVISFVVGAGQSVGQAAQQFAKPFIDAGAAVLRFVGALGALLLPITAVVARLAGLAILLPIMEALKLGFQLLAISLLPITAGLEAIASVLEFLTRGVQGLTEFISTWATRLGLIPPKQREIATETDKQKRGQDDVNKALEDQVQTLERIDNKYKSITASIETQANASKQVAAEQATRALQQTGLKEGDLRAIEAARTRAFAGAERERLTILNASLARQRAEVLAAIPKQGQAEREFRLEQAAKLGEIDQQVSQNRLRIQESFAQDAERIARGIVDAEKAAAEARLRVYVDELQARTDLVRQAAAAQVDLARQQAELIGQTRDAQIASLRLTEETRLGLLRASIAQETALRRASIDITGAGDAAAIARFRSSLDARNRIRAQLVKQGFFTEEEAAKIQAEEERRLETERLNREINLQRQRIALAEFEAQRSAQLAQVEAQSRIAVLGAETDARKQQVDLNAKLRVFDLQNAIAVARTETRAKIIELQAQSAARIAALESELEGGRARGTIGPEEAAARQREIDTLKRGAQAQTQILQQGLEERERLTRAQTDLIERGRVQSITAIEEEAKQKRIQIAQETAAALSKIETERLVAVQTGLAKIQELEAQIPNLVASTAQQVIDVANSGLRTLTGLFTTAANQWRGIFNPVVDLIDRLGKGTGAPGGLGIPVPQAPAVPNLPAVQAPPGGQLQQPAQVFTQTIQVNGTQVHLAADRAVLVDAVMQVLLGPEGARAFEDFLRRRPGPRAIPQSP